MGVCREESGQSALCMARGWPWGWLCLQQGLCCTPGLPIGGRAELQAGLVSNCSEVALNIRYPGLGSPYLSLLEQAPGAPKKDQTEASPAATHCICKTVHDSESSQGLFKACGFKTSACLVDADGLLLCAVAGHALEAAWSMEQT